jgi:hypothetical protein
MAEPTLAARVTVWRMPVRQKSGLVVEAVVPVEITGLMDVVQLVKDDRHYFFTFAPFGPP